jgi:Leucine-rich repeat (LRR) protein
LSGNQLVELPLWQLALLRELHIGGNRLQSIVRVESMVHLEQLSVFPFDFCVGHSNCESFV